MILRGTFIVKTGAVMVVFLCAVSLGLKAQYEASGLILNGTHSSAVNWVDIDGDGDLDASISGDASGSTGKGELIFMEANTVLDTMLIRPIETGDMSWSDFNNDSIPDLLYAGYYLGLTAGIDTFYINSPDSVYGSYVSTFTPVTDCSVDWGDYDNDGDYDVLMAGKDSGGNAITTLYKNEKGKFTNAQAGLSGINIGQVGFIDYDLDKDLDIFICGRDVNLNKYTRLWQNTNGVFSISNNLFTNLIYSKFDWGDFNSDGYPDLLLGGYNGSAKVGYIYYNNAGNSFSLANIKVPGSQNGAMGLGDVDNDGDLDVFVSGLKQTSSLNYKLIFINDGTDSLKPADFVSAYADYNCFQFGDYDKDNDLDLLFNGKFGANGASVIAEDTCSTPNYKPTVPTSLSATVTGTHVLLTWSHATDNSTPQKSLTYNIYMGTTSNGIDIVSPLATISSGFRKISKQGYIQDTVWIIKDLPIGTYYWGVQAIDNSFVPSPFSSEASFEIKGRFTESNFTYPLTSTSPAIYFDCDHDGDYDLFLNESNAFVVALNTASGFNSSNYDTIDANAYKPINTIVPNDYNNNNFLDFSVSGDYTGAIERDSSIALYSFTSAFEYNTIESALAKNVVFEYALWADLNNDGLQDFITSGKTNNLGAGDIPVTNIYQNMGDSSFVKVAHNIKGFELCGAVAADFDNDMDIDIIIYGKDAAANPGTFLYKNDGDFNFTEVEISNNQLYRYQKSYGIVSGDFNLDGQLDIYLSGINSQNDTYARVFLNNSTSFLDANLPIRSWLKMSNFWADYDYDGDLDIFSTSVSSPSDEMRLYLNDKGSLEENIIEFNDWNVLNQPLVVANLDNKNGLDFLMKIENGDYVQYIDNYATYNKLNTAPTNLSYHRDNLDLILTWDKLPDCPGCTYNIWVAEHPDSAFVISPMADTATGFRYVIQPGNAYMNRGWKIKDLAAGTYYWSVQAVDLANTGGPWAVTDTFSIANVNTDFAFDTVCFGDTTSFADLSVATDAVVAWKWSFGDGSMSAVQHPKHTYAVADTFNVGLWAFSQSDDSSFISYDVIVMQLPEVDFNANIACQGELTNFTNQTNSNGLIISDWHWSFGDGSNTIVKDPVDKGYLNPGTYSVKLKATASNGCVDSLLKDVEVGAKPSPSVSLLEGNLTFCEGDSVSLNVVENERYTYQWRINDTDLSGYDSSIIIIKNSGNYNAIITNTVGGCTTTSEVKSVNKLSAPLAPTIFTNGNLSFCPGGSVGLSTDANSEFTFQWLLNGSGVGSNASSYSAQLEGNYSLIVKNNDGCEATSLDNITITHYATPPKPIIQYDATSFCQGDSLQLSTDVVAGSEARWYLNNQLVLSKNTFLQAKIEGLYHLELINENACKSQSESLNLSTWAIPNPVPINPQGANICQGVSQVLSVTAQSGVSYQWYKDGSKLEGEIFDKTTVNESGNYYLKINNNTNCIYTPNSIQIKVSAMPEAQQIMVEGDTNICPGDEVRLYVREKAEYSYQWKVNGDIINEATQNSYIADSKGKYTAIISNIENAACFISAQGKEITYKPALDKPTLLAEGPNVWILACDNANAQAYRWYYQGERIPEATEYIYVANQNLGEYYISVSDGGECFVPSNILTIPLNSTGITETETIFGNIKIFPNPTPGQFTIEMDNQIIGILYIRIVSEQGKELFNIKHTKTTQHFQTQMDLRGQGSGMYFIEFRFEGDRVLRKVVVE